MLAHRVKEIAALASKNTDDSEILNHEPFIIEFTHLMVQDMIWEVVKNEAVPLETQLLLATRLQERFFPKTEKIDKNS